VFAGVRGFGENAIGSTKRQDSRFAQRISAARRARAMDGPSESLDRSQIQKNRPCGGFFVPRRSLMLLHQVRSQSRNPVPDVERQATYTI